MTSGAGRRQIAAAIALLLLAAITALAASNWGPIQGLWIYFGGRPAQLNQEQLRSLLEPAYRWYGGKDMQSSEPRPGLLLVPGCLGTQPFHRQWAEDFAAEGLNVLLIDSFGPRDIDSLDRLEGICEGNELWGFQRAADVLVGLDDLRRHPATNPSSLYLVGWSHGGWALLDAIALAGNRQTPPHLASMPDEPLTGLRAAFAFYPYCGFGTFTRSLPWPADHPATIFLAEHDENIDPAPCGALEASPDHKTLSILHLEADHWFDNPDGFELVPHRYSSEATQLARETILAAIKKES